jgi:hypothetical protein
MTCKKVWPSINHSILSGGDGGGREGVSYLHTMRFLSDQRGEIACLHVMFVYTK